MGTRQETADFLLDQLSRVRATAKRMFGEYGVYCDGKIVALICDNPFFVKPTDAGRAFLGTPREAPPYPGAKMYFLIDGDQCEDADWLCDLIRVTTKAVPPPKPKRKAKSKSKMRARAKPQQPAKKKTAKTRAKARTTSRTNKN